MWMNNLLKSVVCQLTERFSIKIWSCYHWQGDQGLYFNFNLKHLASLPNKVFWLISLCFDGTDIHLSSPLLTFPSLPIYTHSHTFSPGHSHLIIFTFLHTTYFYSPGMTNSRVTQVLIFIWIWNLKFKKWFDHPLAEV